MSPWLGHVAVRALQGAGVPVGRAGLRWGCQAQVELAGMHTRSTDNKDEDLPALQPSSSLATSSTGQDARETPAGELRKAGRAPAPQERAS